MNNADCPLTWTYSVDVMGADPTITFDASVPEFSIFWDTDLVPASANKTPMNPFVSLYAITLTGTNSDGFTQICPFNLQIDTPCGDVNRVMKTNQ